MSQQTHLSRISTILCAAVALGACADAGPTAPGPHTIGTPSFATATATRPGYIRIGVVQSADEVTIGSDGDYVVTNAAGTRLLSGSNGAVRVSLGGTQVSTTHQRLQVACNPDTPEGNADVAQRLADITNAGYPASTAWNATAKCTQVFIGDFTDPADQGWSARAAFKSKMVSLGLAGADAWWNPYTETVGQTVFVLTRGSTVVKSPTAVTLSSSTDLVTIDGRHYRGTAEVAQNSGGTLAGINELPLEQYLYGVVPRELPPNPYGEMEAQKAQAVAARTYAMSGLGKRASDGYDLRATTSDQVYGGFDDEQPASTQAVNETRGVVATYNGRLIEALFSSTTGGFTAGNEEIYNSAPVPYLRSVPDAPRGRALEKVPSLEVFKNAANPVSLRNAAEGDYEADWSRYHRWTFEWTAAEISRVISAYAGEDVGTVQAINVLSRGPSGRVLEIEYVTDAGTFTDTKDGIRSSLKYVTSSGGLASLRSTLFYIEPVTDPRTKALVGFKAYGGGWGHGIGLSQTGAVGMATRGATYEEILKHYYQGIDLETWNTEPTLLP